MGKPTGYRGSWFAAWKGQSLPCVHACWCRPGKGTLTYLDPHVGTDPKWGPFIAAIRAGETVILTTDEMGEDGQPKSRTGYVATYRVRNVAVDGSTLSFEFVQRLENFT